jgi:toxin ParE1/3/4
MRLERSRAAERDLVSIRNFSIERFGAVVARDYFFSFEDAFALLCRHPYAGQSLESVRPGIRKLTHRQHRILYEVLGDRVLILRILHHAMSLDDRF